MLFLYSETIPHQYEKVGAIRVLCMLIFKYFQMEYGRLKVLNSTVASNSQILSFLNFTMNIILIVTVILKYLNLSKFVKDLLAVFILWSSFAFICKPTSLLVSDGVPVFSFTVCFHLINKHEYRAGSDVPLHLNCSWFWLSSTTL
jgi:hypothetical protein